MEGSPIKRKRSSHIIVIDQSKPENKQSPQQLSSEIVRTKVESLYELSCLETPIRVMGGSTESAVWQLKTNRGNWLVKVFKVSKWLSERVADEANLYAYLNQHGIRAPKVLQSKRRRRSEEIEVDMHKYPIIVMELEDVRFTEPSSIRDDELVKIAETIARMHQCLQRYKGSLGFADSPAGRVLASLATSARAVIRMYRSFGPTPRRDNSMVEWIPAGYELLIASPNASAFTSEELAHFLVLDREMKAFLAANSRSPHLTMSITHGDLRLAHIPFLTNGDVYIFDFEARRFGSISEDLAGMLYELYVSDEITYDRWEDLRDWFLNGYTSVLRLTSVDLNAISPFLMNIILSRVSRISKRSIERQGIVQIETIRQHYRFANYLLKSCMKQHSDA